LERAWPLFRSWPTLILSGSGGFGELDCDASQTTEPTIQSAEPTSPMGAWSVDRSGQSRRP